LSEFLGNLKQEDLLNLFKDKEINRSAEFLKNKLLILTYIYIKSGKDKDTSKSSGKVLSNLINIFKKLYTSNESCLVDSLIEMSNLLTDDILVYSQVLKDITQKIIEVADENTDIFLRKHEKISKIISRYISRTQNRENTLDIMRNYTKILEKLHDFSFSDNLNTPLANREIFHNILDNNVSGSLTKELNMYYFYSCSKYISYIDLKDFLILQYPELEREFNLTRQMLSGKDGDFSKFDVDYFNKTYGGDFG
jgi:hypothetical protein